MWLTGRPEADALLAGSDNALLIGMVLDQQIPMEKAFSGPAVIAERMGGSFDVAAIAAMDVDDFVALCSQRPAVHRFPGSMGKRVHQVATALVGDYDGDAANLWRGVDDASVLFRRLKALPGLGEQKARIFLALIGKQRGVQPPGWSAVAGDYGRPGHRSVADVVDGASLQKVREYKKQQKAAAKASAKPVE